ncbi:alpha/beta hydrolase [uncultured Polaribacter sp.]|uniref:alpha/beta hydrolase n=1 Tax=uncultured Polaribacter sp. TaxID=174711 RepID=UPI0030D9121E|tara:strand:+ start:340 stop:1227 length:888 start_codon:yes stop_codon:yes gene_type:complete
MKQTSIKLIFLWILILGIICTIHSQNKTYKPVIFPENYTAELDIIYTTVNNWEGRIDIYSNQNAVKPTPIVLNIHGGGWNHGEKESQTGFSTFFKKGFAVANVEYRLESVAAAPGAIEDIRCALIYLYKNAERLHIDKNKIVIMGGSAGGHLALMAGLQGESKKFDKNCEISEELKIAAIIDKYGPTDLTLFKNYSSVKKWLKQNYGILEFTKSVSPINYVTDKSPPTFIVHGKSDPTIPYEHSVLLYEKLISKNVKTKFISVENGGHGKFEKEDNSKINKEIWLFLEALNLVND